MVRALHVPARNQPTIKQKVLINPRQKSLKGLRNKQSLSRKASSSMLLPRICLPILTPCMPEFGTKRFIVIFK